MLGPDGDCLTLPVPLGQYGDFPTLVPTQDGSDFSSPGETRWPAFSSPAKYGDFLTLRVPLMRAAQFIFMHTSDNTTHQSFEGRLSLTERERQMDFKVLVILMMMIVCSASLATFVAPTHSHPEDGFYDDHMASGLNSVSEDFVLNGRNLLEEGHRIPLWMDVHALLSFKKDIKDPSGKLSNWTIENWQEACSWYGVTCTHHNPRVVAIILPRLNLTGTISPSIGALSLLYTLNLSSNNLTGEIPPEIGQLKALRILDLTGFHRPDAYLYEQDSHLLLSGSIPKSLSNCTSLQYIGFAWNNFTGTIPTEFGRLVHLEQLYLGSNSLGGRIPHTLSNCSKLSTLSLSDNNFTGTIPREFGRLIHLSYLNLEHNSLGGHLPPTLGNCTKLQYISLHENRLFGRIPSSFFCNSLKILDLSENSLSGDLNIRFPVSMIVFKVGSNNFFGPLPPSLANCSNLQILDLWKNRFGGVLPSFLANYNQLQVLDLRKNRFSGELPDYITSFHNLQILSIGYNKFHGCIGEWITNLTKLQILDLSNNEFTGKIPFGLEKLQGFAIGKSAMSKELYYEMEIVIKGFEYLLSYVLAANTILDLSNNNFTGEIPASIGSLSSLRSLNLSWNQLEGKIPASLGTIDTLEELDLSENNLSGGIPQNLSTLKMLAFMNVSSNNLCGPIPLGTQMSTFGETLFQRNKCLCGFPLSACKENKRKLVEGVSGKRNVTEWLCSVDEKISLIALGIGMVIGFGGVLLVFLACKTTRDWVVPLHKPKSFYGEYRLPT